VVMGGERRREKIRVCTTRGGRETVRDAGMDAGKEGRAEEVGGGGGPVHTELVRWRVCRCVHLCACICPSQGLTLTCAAAQERGQQGGGDARIIGARQKTLRNISALPPAAIPALASPRCASPVPSIGGRPNEFAPTRNCKACGSASGYAARGALAGHSARLVGLPRALGGRAATARPVRMRSARPAETALVPGAPQAAAASADCCAGIRKPQRG
jgi:hypothetical protein